MNVLERTVLAPGYITQEPEAEELEFNRWPYVLALPFMVALAAYAHAKRFLCGVLRIPTRYNCLFGDGLSVNGARVRDGAARWPALHVIYNFTHGEGSSVLRRAIDVWWLNIRNAQAVRNRLKIAKRELREAIVSVAKIQGRVRILSLAAGTAQGVIEVAAEFKLRGVPIEIVLVDQDASALRYANELARRLGVEVRTVKGNALFFQNEIGDFRADIVEMMGLIDYLKDLQVTRLFERIWRHLKPKGYFFTCHVHPNTETYFMRHIINWSMRYRTRDALEDLLIAGKFDAPRLITEPHGIHTIAVAQKIV